MIKHPASNALLALLYISIVALSLRSIEEVRQNTPDTFLDAIGILSLLVLSAAVMGTLFFYRPVALLIEHKKSEALSFLLRTLVIFAVFTSIVLILVRQQ